jgi:soluble lytic murein transglycosylase-like protein
LDQAELIKLIHAAAGNHGIDPQLFEAICRVESALDASAIRFEPTYKWLYNPSIFAKRLKITLETEIALQRFSIGPCQIMCAVIREQGYIGHLNVIQNDPAFALNAGARHLKGYLVKYPNRLDAIAAWNAGSPRRASNGDYVNADYVKKVEAELSKLGVQP